MNRMSDDLISRKAVLHILYDIKDDDNVPKNYETVLDIIRKIRKMPTAFDKEKVINEIRSGVMAANDEYIETCDEYYHGMQEAHKNDWKIVEKGGIE